jgi:RNA polymerase sigma-70 factor (TIGR02957 family)
MTDLDTFAAHRPDLFALAYRMLGSASDAEDVLQDAYLRYSAVRADVRAPKAYLNTIVTRLCLDRLKTARARREQYLGPWIPEPLLTPTTSDPQQVAEQHEAVTLAFLVLLEQLTPAERAVFLLRDVFEYPYPQVAAMLDLSEPNCRQLMHRAKRQIAAQRPRFSAPMAQQQQLVERFLAATERGDLEAFTRLLAEDVVFWADSGGKAPAPARPLYGAGVVAKLIQVFTANTLRLVDGAAAAIRSAVSVVNGEPAILIWIHGQLDSVMVCSISGDRISTLRLIRNPEKLQYLRRQLQSERSPP